MREYARVCPREYVYVRVSNCVSQSQTVFSFVRGPHAPRTRARMLLALNSASSLSPSTRGRMALCAGPGMPLRRWLGQVAVARNRLVREIHEYLEL